MYPTLSPYYRRRTTFVVHARQRRPIPIYTLTRHRLKNEIDVLDHLYLSTQARNIILRSTAFLHTRREEGFFLHHRRLSSPLIIPPFVTPEMFLQIIRDHYPVPPLIDDEEHEVDTVDV